jgi:hypothetical protein
VIASLGEGAGRCTPPRGEVRRLRTKGRVGEPDRRLGEWIQICGRSMKADNGVGIVARQGVIDQDRQQIVVSRRLSLTSGHHDPCDSGGPLSWDESSTHGNRSTSQDALADTAMTGSSRLSNPSLRRLLDHQ